jgi:hypothetical protein
VTFKGTIYIRLAECVSEDLASHMTHSLRLRGVHRLLARARVGSHSGELYK